MSSIVDERPQTQTQSCECQHGGVCVPNTDADESDANASAAFMCKCERGRLGRLCEFEDKCVTRAACHNNATCINVLDTASSSGYYCQCGAHFTGAHCDTPLTTTTTSTTTTTTSPSQTTANDNNNNQNNGSFVLVVNIAPEEFRRRQSDIVAEFERKLGIMLLVKRDSLTGLEQIYPHRGGHDGRAHWTKVYFVIIFACVYDSPHSITNQRVAAAAAESTSICLQNDTSKVVSELRNAQQLPSYVSDVSYEYQRRDDNVIGMGKPSQLRSFMSNQTLVMMCMSLLVLVAVSVTLYNVLVSQNGARRVKAPVWFPPPPPGTHQQQQPEEQQQPETNQKQSKKNTWSITGSALANYFSTSLKGASGKRTLASRDEITSDESNGSTLDCAGDYELIEQHQQQQQKKMRVDMSSSTPSSSPPTYAKANNSNNNNNTPSIMIFPPATNETTTTADKTAVSQQQQQQQRRSPPDFYPSPPESLPEQQQQLNILQPINYKGAAYGITPLMLFIVNRSKARNGANQTTQHEADAAADEDALVVDSLLAHGADLGVHNMDGETALHLAARCGLRHICDRLITAVATNAQRDTEANAAALYELLYASDNYGRNVLHTAVGANELDVVRLILTRFASLAATLSVVDAVNVDSHQQSQQQQQSTHLDLIELIDSKTNDELGDTPLTMAARLAHNRLVKLLVEFNATVNATDNEGRSALHWAVKCNNYDGAAILIQSGANVNMQDNDERTPLSAALLELNTLRCADLLVKCDAFVSAADHARYTRMKTLAERLNNGLAAAAEAENNATIKRESIYKQAQSNKQQQVRSDKRKMTATVETLEANTKKALPATSTYNMPLTPPSMYQHHQHQQQQQTLLHSEIYYSSSCEISTPAASASAMRRPSGQCNDYVIAAAAASHSQQPQQQMGAFYGKRQASYINSVSNSINYDLAEGESSNSSTSSNSNIAGESGTNAYANEYGFASYHEQLAHKPTPFQFTAPQLNNNNNNNASMFTSQLQQQQQQQQHHTQTAYLPFAQQQQTHQQHMQPNAANFYYNSASLFNSPNEMYAAYF